MNDNERNGEHVCNPITLDGSNNENNNEGKSSHGQGRPQGTTKKANDENIEKT